MFFLSVCHTCTIIPRDNKHLPRSNNSLLYMMEYSNSVCQQLRSRVVATSEISIRKY